MKNLLVYVRSGNWAEMIHMRLDPNRDLKAQIKRELEAFGLNVQNIIAIEELDDDDDE